MGILITVNAPVYLVAATIILSVGSLGYDYASNTNAIFISHYHTNTGSASALLGTFQALSAAVAGAISTLLNNGTLWPIFGCLLVVSLLSSVILLRAKWIEKGVFRKFIAEVAVD